MLEEANSWYLTSTQDLNVQTKHEHVSFALAYLNAARRILNDSGLERLSGIDVHELQKSIDVTKRTSSKEMLRQCPRLKHHDLHTGKLPVKKTADW